MMNWVDSGTKNHIVHEAKCEKLIDRYLLLLVLYLDDPHPINTPTSIIIVGMIFIHRGSLHLALIFGIIHTMTDPDTTDKTDIVTIGLITAGDSTEDEHGLCSRGPHRVITRNRIE